MDEVEVDVSVIPIQSPSPEPTPYQYGQPSFQTEDHFLMNHTLILWNLAWRLWVAAIPKNHIGFQPRGEMNKDGREAGQQGGRGWGWGIGGGEWRPSLGLMTPGLRRWRLKMSLHVLVPHIIEIFQWKRNIECPLSSAINLQLNL